MQLRIQFYCGVFHADYATFATRQAVGTDDNAYL